MAVEINNNPGGNDGGNSAMTAIVAILVIVIIGLAVYFGFFRGAGAPVDSGTNIDINATLPTGSGQEGGPAY
jgi:hypothetical protein